MLNTFLPDAMSPQKVKVQGKDLFRNGMKEFERIVDPLFYLSASLTEAIPRMPSFSDTLSLSLSPSLSFSLLLAAHLGIELRFPSFHPAKSLTAMRAIASLSRNEDRRALAKALYEVQATIILPFLVTSPLPLKHSEPSNTIALLSLLPLQYSLSNTIPFLMLLHGILRGIEVKTSSLTFSFLYILLYISLDLLETPPRHWTD